MPKLCDADGLVVDCCFTPGSTGGNGDKKGGERDASFDVNVRWILLAISDGFDFETHLRAAPWHSA